MTSWLARDLYAPAWVLCAGLLTFWGTLRVGRLVTRAVPGSRASSLLDAVTAVLLGILMLGGAVELLGVLHLASRGALLTLIGALWIAGLFELARAIPALIDGIRAARARDHSAPERIALFLLLATLAINLMIAVAPSTKFDEIFYHMLVPARVVHDEALRFYAYPLHAAAMPQFSYQVALAPLHALLVPDAANVMSWALSVTMFWLFYRVLLRAGHDHTWAALWCAALSAGLHTAVNHVTAGSHAFGELAVAALVLAALQPEALDLEPGSPAYAFSLGVCAAAAVMSKVSTIPVALIFLMLGIHRIRRRHADPSWIGAAIIAVVPTAVFLAPVVVWQWSASGAPFGPFLSALFGHSVYDHVPVRAMMLGDPISLVELATGWTPLLWIGVAGGIFASTIARKDRLALGVIVVAQAVFIWTSLTIHPRFLSGLTYASAMVFALAPPARFQDWLRPARRRILCLALLVAPWVAVSAYYARPFAAVDFGVETPERFRERFIANYADFRALDSLLPADAVLLTAEHLPSVYAPRFMVWSASDAPTNAPLFQVGADCVPVDSSRVVVDTVYLNPRARTVVFRDPRRDAIEETFCAVRLTP